MNLRQFIFILLALPLHAFAASNYTNIDNQQLKALQAQGTPLYDVRRADEWAQTGVIKGSHKLTFVDNQGRVMPGFVEKFTKAIGKNDPVILICRTGHRTDTLTHALVEQLGYTKIYNVKNGITHWIGEGLPVERN